MVTVTTDSGFTCTVDERRFRDFRVVRACSMVMKKDSDTDKVIEAASIVPLILGDQEDALYEHIADDGYVDTDKVFAEMFDIMQKAMGQSAEVKKS